MTNRPVTILMIFLVLVADAIQFVLLLSIKHLAPYLAALISAADVPAVGAALAAIIASPWVWVAALSMISSFTVWMTVLAKLDLSIAFPLGSVSFLLVPLMSAMLLDERVPALRWVGFALIAVGIIALSLGARRQRSGT